MEKPIQFYYTNINIWKCFVKPYNFAEIQVKNSEREIILRIPQPYPITQTGNKEQKSLIDRKIN